MLRAENCKMVLGTDSYASNSQLNMLEEIKTIKKHFTEIPVAAILGWATLNGAQALGLEDQFGSFEKGKKPGVVLISTTDYESLGDAAATRLL